MKILYTLNSSEPGGMEQHVHDLVKGMLGNGHAVFVVCPKGEMSNRYQKEGAVVLNTNIKFELDPLYILFLYKLMKREQIDLIHAHELKAVCNSLLAAFLAGVKKKISHTHTPISTWRISSLKKSIDRAFNTLLVNLFSSYEIALTEAVKKIKIAEGIRKDKIEVIPNSVTAKDLQMTEEGRLQSRTEIREKYGIPREAVVFGCVGRLTVEKNHALLIQAFHQLHSTGFFANKEVFILIAGGGLLEYKLRQQIKDLGLSQKILITGIFASGDQKKFYATFDAFVFPSLAEGFGIVLVEAMYSQVPVLCSDLGILKEVGADTVTYFKNGSPEDLVEQMKVMYSMIVSGDKINTTLAKERVESLYSFDKFVENYQQLYLK